jgi:hypothetical protein
MCTCNLIALRTLTDLKVINIIKSIIIAYTRYDIIGTLSLSRYVIALSAVDHFRRINCIIKRNYRTDLSRFETELLQYQMDVFHRITTLPLRCIALSLRPLSHGIIALSHEIIAFLTE